MAGLFPFDPRLSLGQALSGRVPLSSTTTPLPPQAMSQFLSWKNQYAPNDSGEDYDLQGAFLHGVKPDPQTGHWPDTWKRPNHPTFSNESIYSGLAGTNPGSWDGDQFIPGKGPQQTWKGLSPELIALLASFGGQGRP
jgi:hypothetical protein